MEVIKKCDCYLTQGTRCTCNDPTYEENKAMKEAEKKEIYLMNKNKPIPEKLTNKIKLYDEELSKCYERETRLMDRIKELEQRNGFLEVKYEKIRQLALKPYEKYSHDEDRMGR